MIIFLGQTCSTESGWYYSTVLIHPSNMTSSYCLLTTLLLMIDILFTILLFTLSTSLGLVIFSSVLLCKIVIFSTVLIILSTVAILSTLLLFMVVIIIYGLHFDHSQKAEKGLLFVQYLSFQGFYLSYNFVDNFCINGRYK